MQDLEKEVVVNVESHFVSQDDHELVDGSQMALSFRAEENTQDSYGIEPETFCSPAAISFVDQDATEPALQGESDRLCLSDAQILLQGLHSAPVTDRHDHDEPLINRLVNRLHSGILPDRFQLVQNSVRNEHFVEKPPQNMELPNRRQVEQW